MQYRIDGDKLMLFANSFINLQESPALFIPLTSDLATAILAEPVSNELSSELNALLPPLGCVDLPSVRFDRNWVYVEYPSQGTAFPIHEFLRLIKNIVPPIR
jgi:hypothetical protein